MADAVTQRISILEKKVGPHAKSPLFAQLAALYLQAGRPQDALRVCDDGLGNFPFYTTGHLIKGKALLGLNMQAEARREFEWVLDVLPGTASVRNLLTATPPAAEATLSGKSSSAPVEPAPAVTPPEPAEPSPSPFNLPTEPPPTAAFEATPETELAGQTPPDVGGFTGLAPAEPTGDEQTTATAQPEPSEPQEDQGFGFTGLTPPEPTPPDAFPQEGVADSAPAATEDDPFGLAGAVPQPPVQEPGTPSSGGFAFPAAPEPDQTFAPTTSDDPFGAFAASAPAEEGSFEAYASRKRGELEGENTMSLDEYLNNGSPGPSASTAPATIEEITEKLQSPPKITPIINFAQRSVPTASQTESSSSAGFVTPTLAEIYAKQGWYDDAIKAYRTLAANKPAEREKYEQRIVELEELKKQQG